jgi:hypothetical protein
MPFHSPEQALPGRPCPFDSVYDALIYGTGWIGYAAARTLADRGARVLLVGPDGDLLWESTRALEIGTPGDSSAWDLWLEALRAEGGANEDCLDPALAEIRVARELSREGTTLAPLLYTPAADALLCDNRLTALTLATKDGWRRVRAHTFIDASEHGDLLRLCNETVTASRVPDHNWRGLVLHSDQARELEAAADTFKRDFPHIRWEASSLNDWERRLRWEATAEPASAEQEAVIRALRKALPVEAPAFVVSYLSWSDYPQYTTAETPPVAARPDNLLVLSPACRGQAIRTLADRFALGASVSLPASSARSAPAELPPLCPPQPVEDWKQTDVLVAGAGTAGAVAAIAAARNGARTLALDFVPVPGGVGTGGAICGYFYGHPGGLQDEIDEHTIEMMPLLTGHKGNAHGWHHAAKALVLARLFREAGVEFIPGAFVCAVERDDRGTIRAVQALYQGRLIRFPLKACIDATGDGDLCALAGAEYSQGRCGDSRTLAYSQSALFLSSDGPRGVRVRACNYDAGWADFTRPEDITRARLIGIAQYHREHWEPEKRPLWIAPVLGVRQSRQFLTDAEVTLDDLVFHTTRPDNIGEVRTVADTHSVDFEFESDELAYYYWICRGFKNLQHCQMPYGMLLPRGLRNLWLACRSAGVANDASYGLRMQREMQRLGEAAGIAAALTAPTGGESRSVPLAQLQERLALSGSTQPVGEVPENLVSDPVQTLYRGLPGVYLWQLYRAPESTRPALLQALSSEDATVSFYAAAVLAMRGETRAEPRLLRALEHSEEGPEPEALWVPGAFNQCVDIPFWLQTVFLLRRIGTAACLPALAELAERPGHPFNVKTIIAGTLERLAARLGHAEEIVHAVNALIAEPPADAVQPPSRSLWNTLHGKPQKKLSNDYGAATSQDHTWQLELLVARTRLRLGLDVQPSAHAYLNDPRGFVRGAFEEVFAQPRIESSLAAPTA